MEKEFEALEWLNNTLWQFLNKTTDTYCQITLSRNQATEFVEEHKKVNQALTELKAIKEAKPSEALECVDVLKEDGCITTLYQGKALETIRQTLENFDLTTDFLKDLAKLTNETGLNNIMEKLQEQEKVLEIIKEKGLPLGEIKMIKQSENYEKYVIDFSWANFKNISIQKTQEEFDLLNRYFGKNIQKQ